jgi:hypothetical protein
LQAWFSDTPVKVAVDHSQVFADILTTHFILAFAAIIPVQVFNGTHFLSLTVAEAVSKDTTFTIADTLYIGVNSDATTPRITYHFQRWPFHCRSVRF